MLWAAYWRIHTGYHMHTSCGTHLLLLALSTGIMPAQFLSPTELTVSEVLMQNRTVYPRVLHRHTSRAMLTPVCKESTAPSY